MTSVIDDTRVRDIVSEEVFLSLLVQEGMWDDVGDGVRKLRAAATKKFGSVAGKWASSVKGTLSKMNRMPSEVTDTMKVIQAAMRDTGESLKLDDTLQAAKALGQMGVSGALELAQSDLEGPVHAKAEKASSSVKGEGVYRHGIYAIMVESPLSEDLERIDEVTVVSAIGMTLAALGGSIMLFKGLSKLAGWLGAEKLSHLFHKVEHVLHGLETKAVDVVVPDRIAYFVYSFLYDRNMKIGEPGKKDEGKLSLAEFRSDGTGSHAMTVTKGFIYKVLLIYFAWHGIEGAVKAGASLLGFVESAATTVKGVEIASGAGELIALARSATV